MLTEVLKMCIGSVNSDVKQFSMNINLAKYEFSVLSWCIPVFQSISLISDGHTSLQHPGVHERSGSSILSLYIEPAFLTLPWIDINILNCFQEYPLLFYS